MPVVMGADQQWVKYRRSVVPGRSPAISLLLALLLAVSPGLEGKAPCHLPLRQSASSLFWWETVEETNRYALELQEKREPEVRGKLTKWMTTTISEMLTFLVTVLLMGIVKMNCLKGIMEHGSYVCNSLICCPLFPRLLPSSVAMPTFHQQCYCQPKWPVTQKENVLTSLTSPFGWTFLPYKDLCFVPDFMEVVGWCSVNIFSPKNTGLGSSSLLCATWSQDFSRTL